MSDNPTKDDEVHEPLLAGFALREYQATIEEINLEKGWYNTERPFDADIALLHTEVSEAYEAYRSGSYMAVWYETDKDGLQKPEGVPIELADVVIRVLDTCTRYGVDIEEMIQTKLAYNRQRPVRHGGKIV